MSDKEASRFINDVQNDAAFAEQLTKSRSNPEAVWELVQSKGYDATKEEISAAYLEYASSVLTEEQLQEVAAGLSNDQKAYIAAGTIGGTAAVAIGFGVTIAVVTTVSASAAAAL